MTTYHRIGSFSAALAFATLVGCGGSDTSFEQTDRELIVEPGTETIEIEIPTEDTLMVERTIETEISVDTMEVEPGTTVAPEN